MKKFKVAVVMPTHFNIHSSLANFIKTYEYLIDHNNVEVTLLTDKKNDIVLPKFKIQKINGVDYGTIFEKALFVLGIPRYYYQNLDKELEGFDAIFANNPEFYAYSFQAYKAAKHHGTRFFLRTSQTVEGFFLYKLTKYIINPIVKDSYDYASCCIFTNPEAKERCVKLKLIDEEKRSIITGHATDTETFKPIDVKKPQKPVLLSVGGLLELKGHHLIIKALKKIIDSGIEAELWIVGEGYYRQKLEELSKELNIGDRVKFLGNKGHEELVKLYNQSSVFVLANYQEITPAVNEALACEIPVVVMECGGREFVLPSDKYGLISKKFDVDDMAEKIITLMNDKERAKEMAKRGRQRVLDNFSVERVAEKIYDAIRG